MELYLNSPRPSTGKCIFCRYKKALKAIDKWVVPLTTNQFLGYSRCSNLIADVVKLVDTHVWGACAQAWRFESVHPHHFSSFLLIFLSNSKKTLKTSFFTKYFSFLSESYLLGKEIALSLEFLLNWLFQGALKDLIWMGWYTFYIIADFLSF